MEMGSASFAVASNCALIWGGLRVVQVWGAFVRNEWEELRQEPLGLLPISLIWLVLWIAVEAAYYAVARVTFALTAGAVDMRVGEWILVLVLIKFCVLGGFIAHVIPKWRAEGNDADVVRRKSLALGAEMLGIFLLVFWFLF